MVRGNTPIWNGKDVGFIWGPLPGHSRTEADVIHAAVEGFLRVKMSPRDGARGQVAVGSGLVVAIPFGGAGVNERLFSAAQDGLDRLRVLQVVEVAEDDQV